MAGNKDAYEFTEEEVQERQRERIFKVLKLEDVDQLANANLIPQFAPISIGGGDHKRAFWDKLLMRGAPEIIYICNESDRHILIR
jgi:hypothetical protein